MNERYAIVKQKTPDDQGKVVSERSDLRESVLLVEALVRKGKRGETFLLYNRETKELLFAGKVCSLCGKGEFARALSLPIDSIMCTN